MNRKERRKAGIKNPPVEATYLMTASQIEQMKKDAADQAYTKIKALMDHEIEQRILELDAQFSTDLDATVLWVLQIGFGFGEKRLRRYWELFIEAHKYLREHYGEGDGPYKCRMELKKIGVDVDKWNKELEGSNDDRK